MEGSKVRFSLRKRLVRSVQDTKHYPPCPSIRRLTMPEVRGQEKPEEYDFSQEYNRKNTETRMKKLIITLFVFIVSASFVYSQNKTLKGRVITVQGETMPGVSILINDTVEVGKTDLNGFFQIDVSNSAKKLLFVDIGLDPAPIVLFENCDEVEVVMMLTGTFDFISLKKADRLRMKRFKELPEIHKVAFTQGIFKTEKACYTQEFVPFSNREEK